MARRDGGGVMWKLVLDLVYNSWASLPRGVDGLFWR